MWAFSHRLPPRDAWNLQLYYWSNKDTPKTHTTIPQTPEMCIPWWLFTKYRLWPVRADCIGCYWLCNINRHGWLTLSPVCHIVQVVDMYNSSWSCEWYTSWISLQGKVRVGLALGECFQEVGGTDLKLVVMYDISLRLKGSNRKWHHFLSNLGSWINFLLGSKGLIQIRFKWFHQRNPMWWFCWLPIIAVDSEAI